MRSLCSITGAKEIYPVLEGEQKVSGAVEKECRVCKIVKPRESFWKKGQKRGCQIYRAVCKICYRNISKKYKIKSQNSPEKTRAQVMLRTWVKAGKIKKPDFCTICGKTKVRINAHHANYSQPLVVAWVCCQCHADIHKPKPVLPINWPDRPYRRSIENDLKLWDSSKTLRELSAIIGKSTNNLRHLARRRKLDFKRMQPPFNNGERGWKDAQFNLINYLLDNFFGSFIYCDSSVAVSDRHVYDLFYRGQYQHSVHIEIFEEVIYNGERGGFDE